MSGSFSAAISDVDVDFSSIPASDLALLLPKLPSFLHQTPEARRRQQFRVLSTRLVAHLTDDQDRTSQDNSLSRAIQQILAVSPRPAADEAHRAWLLLQNVISQLPRSAMEQFRPALGHIERLHYHFPEIDLSGEAVDILRYLNSRCAYVPMSKTDYLAVRSIQEGVHTAEEMRPLIPGLLSWLQDANWPMCSASCEQLSRFPALAVEGVRSVLQHLNGDDGEWEGNLLRFVGTVPPALRESLRPEIERIVQRPTASETAHEVSELVIELLVAMDWWAHRPLKVRSQPAEDLGQD
ncbi:DUF5071 domain-containing protein [Mycena chlorophos]|uniref:DUF5071 domain-containing protein n=1 Tax=Mycena chlorophos TaxID=658473 RepID=A0A8H6SVD2_MYCCL|nr:DUF5071 domain-containing protein [Mycena chlorophos]